MDPERLKVLSLCGTFPNPGEPGCGTFSRASLTALAEIADVAVIAPIAPCDYDNPNRRGLGRRSVPLVRQDGNLQILHPAWLYFPGNLAVNGFCLAASLLWTVLRLRRRFRFDLIDAHWCHPEGVAGWLLARLCGCPYVVRLHGNELVNSRPRFRRMLMSRALRGASRLVAVSDQLRNLAVSLGADGKNIRVIPNGVDTTIFFPKGRSARARPLIVSAGRLVEAKGHQYAIEALRIMHDRNVDAELVIAGAASRGLPDYEGNLRDLVARRGLEKSVRFLGWIPPDRLAGWMSAADVFCLPSLREGCPNVILEALACGTPVVAADVGMVRELVPTPEFGLIVRAGDTNLLASALEQSLQKEWNRTAISQWGQARSWHHVASEMHQQLCAAAGK